MSSLGRLRARRLAVIGAVAALTSSVASAGFLTVVPPAGATSNNCSQVSTTGANLTNGDFSGCDFTSQDLSNLDFTGSNLTGAVLTGANVSGTKFASAQLTNVVSGNLSGTPASLPTTWSLVNGFLVQQGSTTSTTGKDSNQPPGMPARSPCNTWIQFTTPAGTTGLSADVIGAAGGDSSAGTLNSFNIDSGGNPGSGGHGGQGTEITGSIPWSTSSGSLYANPGCGGIFGGGNNSNGGLTNGPPGGAGIGSGGAGGSTNINCSFCTDPVRNIGGPRGGSGGALSELCQSQTDATTCFLIAGGGGGGGGGGTVVGDNGGDGGSFAFPNGGDDAFASAPSSNCATGGKAAVNGGGGGAGAGDSTNGSGGSGSNGGAGGTGGDGDEDFAGGGGGGGGGQQGGGGGGGNESVAGGSIGALNCSGGGGGGAGSSLCGSTTITFTPACSVSNSALPHLNLNRTTGGQVTVNFSGTVPPPPITSGTGVAWTYGQTVNTPLTSLASTQPTVTETGTLPNGINFNNGALSGMPTQVGSFPIQVTATNGFGSNTRSLTITVVPAHTTTTVTPSANPSGFGQPVTYTATVAPVAPGAGTPTGTVTFSEGGMILAKDVPLSSGQASFTTGSLAPGNHTITASYGGDGNFLLSSNTASPLVQSVGCSRTITSSQASNLVVNSSTCVNPGVTVGGVIVVNPGGSLAIQGATIVGAIKSNGAAAVRICASNLQGTVSVSATKGAVVIGDGGDDGTPTCAPNSLGVSLTLANNQGQVEVGGNHVGNSMSVTGSSGQGLGVENATSELEANTIGGSLICSGNVPAPTNDGQPNAVTGARSGQCGAASF